MLSGRQSRWEVGSPVLYAKVAQPGESGVLWT